MKRFEGIVVSTKMKDTVVVEVERKSPHPLYKKLIKRSKRYKVHPNGMEIVLGQRVKIIETRPMASSKHFKIELETKAKKEKKK